MQMAPLDGRYESSARLSRLEQSAAAVDMLTHRQVPIRYADRQALSGGVAALDGGRIRIRPRYRRGAEEMGTRFVQDVGNREAGGCPDLRVSRCFFSVPSHPTLGAIERLQGLVRECARSARALDRDVKRVHET